MWRKYLDETQKNTQLSDFTYITFFEEFPDFIVLEEKTIIEKKGRTLN